MPATSGLIAVFEHEPDLLAGLDGPTAEHLRRRAGARRLRLDPGPWRSAYSHEETSAHLGLLLLDGVLVRTLRLAGRDRAELVGPGDLLRPWDGEPFGASIDWDNEWRVLRPATLAALDEDFAARVARWPSIAAQLLARTTLRCRSVVYQATIAHVRHADTRVQLLLWHLADRWGRVTPTGVVVPIPLTHQLLAQLTCLQRPTVSGAVSRLMAEGRLSRSDDGGWVLHGEPPAVAAELLDVVSA